LPVLDVFELLQEVDRLDHWHLFRKLEPGLLSLEQERSISN